MNKGRFLPFPRRFWAPSNTIPELMRNPSEDRGKHAHNRTSRTIHCNVKNTLAIEIPSHCRKICRRKVFSCIFISSVLSALVYHSISISFIFSSARWIYYSPIPLWLNVLLKSKSKSKYFGSICCRHSFHSLGAFNPSILCEKFNNGEHCKLLLMAMGW